jgi:hypothetical protein
MKMGKLIVYKGDAEKSSEKDEQRDEHIKVGAVGGLLAGALAVGVAAATEESFPLLKVASLIAVGAGAGYLFKDALSSATDKFSRYTDLDAKMVLLELAQDREALIHSDKNIFESYVDAYQIETEIYGFAYEMARNEAERKTIYETYDKLVAAINAFDEETAKVYGSLSKDELRDVSQKKEVLRKEYTEVTERIASIQKNEKEGQSLTDMMERRYLKTLANRKARKKYGELYLGSIDDLILLLNDALKSNKKCEIHKAVVKVKEKRRFIEKSFTTFTRFVDDVREKESSMLGRAKRTSRGVSVDMTYASAPFYRDFSVGCTLGSVKASTANEFSILLEAGKTDYGLRLDKGTWLSQRNYNDIDPLGIIFSADEKKELTDALSPYLGENETPDESSLEKAYRKMAKNNHSDTADIVDSERMARVSTLMKKYRRYNKEKRCSDGTASEV